jgi:hypothetical protein
VATAADGNRDVIRTTDLDAGESGRRDPNHLDRVTIQCDGAADDGRVSAELPLPKTVTDDCAWHAAPDAID